MKDEPRNVLELGDGKTGRVVPYHPKDWQKGNSVFNEFFDREEIADNKTVAPGRPTSGKHYSRHFDADSISQFLHKATQPPQNLAKTNYKKGQSPPPDDAHSHIAKTFNEQRKVEDLLHKLHDYLKDGKLDEDGLSLPQIPGASTQFDTNSLAGETALNQPIPEIPDEDDKDFEDYKTAPIAALKDQ